MNEIWSFWAINNTVKNLQYVGNNANTPVKKQTHADEKRIRKKIYNRKLCVALFMLCAAYHMSVATLSGS